MSKRLNEKFLDAYIQLDRNCCDKFGVSVSGVTEYINRLNNARFAPGRDDALPRLVRYRGIRNKLAHEVASIRRLNEVTKQDVAWIKKFDRDLTRKKDPLSVYLRKARGYARRKKAKAIITWGAVGLAVIAVLAIVLAFLLK